MSDSVDGDIRIHRPVAFLYPPQPVEACAMPREFFRPFPDLAELVTEALASLGWDARMRRDAVSWSVGPRSARGMQCAHVGAAAFSWAATQLLAEAGVVPDVVFGHSLGLHTALVVSGAVMITDALEVVNRTARLIAEPPDAAQGAMLAVTGFTPDEIAGHCERVHSPGSIFVAIVNSRRQVVVSGLRPAVDRCLRCLRDKEAWGLKRLPGRLPLHSPLMGSLTEPCADLVENARCHVPHVPVIHPSTGGAIRTASGITRLWRTHLLGGIDFVQCMDAMKRMGIATFVELGVGETLGRLVRWYRRDLPVFSIGRPETLERIIDAGMG